MGWDGSGNFSRTNGTNSGTETWQDDAAAATKIRADRHDTHDQDLADGISACLTKNNESKPTADFLPNVDASYDLGSGSFQWVDLHLSGDIAVGGTVDGIDIATTIGSTNVKLNTEVIDIGDWNMDSTSAIFVAHGLTLSTIRSIQCIIRNDAATVFSNLAADWSTAGTSGTEISANSTNVELVRQNAGPFDNSNYNSTSYNRGWITIQYTD